MAVDHSIRIAGLQLLTALVLTLCLPPSTLARALIGLDRTMRGETPRGVTAYGH
jgi:hypothetical protein